MTITALTTGHRDRPQDREWETPEAYWKRIGIELGEGATLEGKGFTKGATFPTDDTYKITSARLDVNLTQRSGTSPKNKVVAIVTGMKWKAYA